MTKDHMREDLRVMARAERVVSEDTAKLRESISSQHRSRRGRHARTQARDDNGQFAPEQD